MLFNSYEFIFIYLPIVIVGYYSIARIFFNKNDDVRAVKYGTLWLVIMSFAFYSYWSIKYVPLLFFSISFNYFIGNIIRKYRENKYLIVGIIGNILLLAYYKYTGFFVENINYILGMSYEIPNIILPLGISFFTFTQTAYLIDAYRGETEKTSFITYCEFVTIFPHLIAGPIINYKKMIPQFINKDNFKVNYDNIALGIILFVIGLFKKVVIADGFAPQVAEIFSRTENLTFIEAWIGALSYTLQLYFDFSGYSEMAIGLGYMINLTIPVNFNSPYQARSVIDFWRRWHMTLGAWVKDYLYIPMGGNRVSVLCQMRNLLISMLIIGFWHGAGWTFVLWGGTHGLLLVINHQWRKIKIELPNIVNWVITFIAVVICWVMFRAENISDGINVLLSMTDIYNLGIDIKYYDKLYWLGEVFSEWRLKPQMHQVMIWICVALIVVFKVKNPLQYIDRIKPNALWAFITFILLISVLYNMSADSEFLYFQF